MPSATTEYRAHYLQRPGALRPVACALLLLICAAAKAQTWRVHTTVEAQVTASDNIGNNAGGAERKDLVLELRPRMRVTTRGGGLRIDGSIGLDGVAYAKSSEYNSLAPNVNLSLGAVVVERLLFVDAQVDVAPTSVDTFAVRREANSFSQSNSELRYRAMISPYLQREVAPDTVVLARTDLSWIRSNGSALLTGAQPDTRFENSVLRFERQPRPMGVLAELTRQKLTDQDTGTVTSTIDAVRIGASYNFNDQFALGAIVGREHSAYLLNDDYDTIKGVSLRWAPSQRTDFRAAIEDRFFGKGGELVFSHRAPQYAISGGLSRRPVSAPVSFGVLPAGGNVAALLDALLTTRYPNDLERAGVVNSVIAERGLPATLNSPLETLSQTPQLVDDVNFSAALLGVRHSIALNLFSRRTQELTRAGGVALGLNPVDNRQYGGALQLGRRMTPTRSIDLTLAATATDGQGPLAGQYTRDISARLSVSEAISPRANVTLGVARHNVRSSVAPDSQENRVFFGIVQRL